MQIFMESRGSTHPHINMNAHKRGHCTYKSKFKPPDEYCTWCRLHTRNQPLKTILGLIPCASGSHTPLPHFSSCIFTYIYIYIYICTYIFTDGYFEMLAGKLCKHVQADVLLVTYTTSVFLSNCQSCHSESLSPAWFLRREPDHKL